MDWPFANAPISAVATVLTTICLAVGFGCATRGPDRDTVAVPQTPADLLGSWRGKGPAGASTTLSFCAGNTFLLAHGTPEKGADDKAPTEPTSVEGTYGATSNGEELLVDVLIPQQKTLKQRAYVEHRYWRVLSPQQGSLKVQTLRGARLATQHFSRCTSCVEACSAFRPSGPASGTVTIIEDSQVLFEGEAHLGQRLSLKNGMTLVVVDHISSYAGYGAGVAFALLPTPSSPYERFYAHQEHPRLVAQAGHALDVQLSGWESKKEDPVMGSTLNAREVAQLLDELSEANNGRPYDADVVRQLRDKDRQDPLVPVGPEASDFDKVMQQIDVLFQHRRFVEAVPLLKEVSRRYPDARRPPNLLGRCLFFMGHAGRAFGIFVTESKRSLGETERDGPEEDRATFFMVDALFLLGAVVAETPWLTQVYHLDTGIWAWETYQQAAPNSPNREKVATGLSALRERKRAALSAASAE